MESSLIIVMVIACSVAVGAGVFTAMSGSKQREDNQPPEQSEHDKGDT